MAGVNETVTGVCAQAPDREASWETIFLALFAIAINTMLQDAGAVCDGEPSLGFLLRSSPMISFLDGCYLVGRGLHFALTARSIPEAHASLLRLRFQRWSTGDNRNEASRQEDGTDKFRRLQWNTLRLVALAFAVLPAIKFFAITGLYWERIVAGMYIGPFVLLEILKIFSGDGIDRARGSTENRRGLPSSGLCSPSYISVAISVAFLSYFQAGVAESLLGDSRAHLLRYFGLVTTICWALPLTFAFIMCLMDIKRLRDAITPALYLLPMLGLPTVYYLFGQRLRPAIPNEPLFEAICLTFLVIWTLSGAKYAAVATKLARDNATENQNQHRRIIEITLAAWFASWHLVTLILFLKLSYDPSGTVKPAWTEHLG